MLGICGHDGSRSGELGCLTPVAAKFLQHLVRGLGNGIIPEMKGKFQIAPSKSNSASEDDTSNAVVDWGVAQKIQFRRPRSAAVHVFVVFFFRLLFLFLILLLLVLLVLVLVLFFLVSVCFCLHPWCEGGPFTSSAPRDGGIDMVQQHTSRVPIILTFAPVTTPRRCEVAPSSV